MHITINGKQTELPDATTLLSLLETRKLDPATVVIELNRDILPGDQFTTTTLTDGDKLEILRFVGGG